MDDLPDTYFLQTVEQLRTLADPLRLRITDLLGQRAMTVTQIGEAIGVPANKTHYHVRELERVGLVRLVETREKGGILEKYFRLVARGLNVPKELIRGVSPDESVAMAGELLQVIGRNFLRAFSQAVRTEEWEDESLNLSTVELCLTTEEMRTLLAQIEGLFKPFERRRGVADGARPHTLVLLAHPNVAPTVEDEALAGGRVSLTPQPPDAPGETRRKPDEGPAGPTKGLTVQLDVGAPAKRRRVIVAGAVGYGRGELERLAETGQTLDLNVLGYLTFAHDVRAELVDRVVTSVRHKGPLHASPAVRDVLKRKGA